MAKAKLLFLPAPAAGHLSSTLQVAKKILQATNNNTVLLPKFPNSESSSSFSATSAVQSLASSGLDVHFQELPPVDPPLDAEYPEEFATLLFQKYKIHVQSAISASAVPVSALFIDFFATAVIDAASELGIPTYVHFTSTALMLSLMLYLPILDEKIGEAEFEEIEEGIELPGIRPIPPVSLPNPMWKKKGGNYASYVYHGRRFREAKGIVVNTFEELEPEQLRLLAEGRFVPDCSAPAVYPIGPLLSPNDRTGSEQHACLKWLDKQPPASVVFLCFGSMGSFDVAQVRIEQLCMSFAFL